MSDYYKQVPIEEYAHFSKTILEDLISQNIPQWEQYCDGKDTLSGYFVGRLRKSGMQCRPEEVLLMLETGKKCFKRPFISGYIADEFDLRS
jgi:hypothetical protein